MVSQQYLKDYAEKIYRHVEGYSFDKVIRLFPMLYIQIKYYYDVLKAAEFEESFRNMFVLFKGKMFELNKLVRDELEAYHLFFQNQAFLEESGAPEDVLKELQLMEMSFLKSQNELYKQNAAAYKAWLEESKYYGIYEYVKPKGERQLSILKQEYKLNEHMFKLFVTKIQRRIK